MRLTYTRRASRQIDDILAHLSARSLHGADSLIERMLEIEVLLRQYPLSGRATTIAGIRRIAMVSHPYVIDYRVVGADLIIQRVRHAARRPTD